MTKTPKPKKGILDWAFNSPEEATVSTAPPSISSPSAIPPPPPPSSGTVYPSFSPTPLPQPVAAPVSNMPDPAALAKVQEFVYRPINDRPSKFLPFLAMHEKLGRPADVMTVVGALQIVDQTFTVESIAADARVHEKLLTEFHEASEQDVVAHRAATIGARDQEIRELESAQTTAQEEIARHNRETQERATKIASLTQQRADEEAKIAHAQQIFAVAENYIRASLSSAVSLLQPKG